MIYKHDRQPKHSLHPAVNFSVARDRKPSKVKTVRLEKADLSMSYVFCCFVCP